MPPAPFVSFSWGVYQFEKDFTQLHWCLRKLHFMRPGGAGKSLHFSAEFFGITMSYHPKLSMIIIQKTGLPIEATLS